MNKTYCLFFLLSMWLTLETSKKKHLFEGDVGLTIVNLSKELEQDEIVQE